MTREPKPTHRNQLSATELYINGLYIITPFPQPPIKHSDMEKQHDSFGKSVWVHA